MCPGVAQDTNDDVDTHQKGTFRIILNFKYDKLTNIISFQSYKFICVCIHLYVFMYMYECVFVCVCACTARCQH